MGTGCPWWTWQCGDVGGTRGKRGCLRGRGPEGTGSPATSEGGHARWRGERTGRRRSGGGQKCGAL